MLSVGRHRSGPAWRALAIAVCLAMCGCAALGQSPVPDDPGTGKASKGKAPEPAAAIQGPDPLFSMPETPPEPLRLSRRHPFFQITLPGDYIVEPGGAAEPGLLFRAKGPGRDEELVLRVRPYGREVTAGELASGLAKREREDLYRLLKGADFGRAQRVEFGGLPGTAFTYRAGGKDCLRILTPAGRWLYVATISPVDPRDINQSADLLATLSLTPPGERPAPSEAKLTQRQLLERRIYSFDPRSMAQARRQLRRLRGERPRDLDLIPLQTEAVALQALACKRMNKKAEPVGWRRQRVKAVSAWRADPEDASAVRALGLAKLMEGDAKKAGFYLHKAVELAPEDGANHLALAFLFSDPAAQALQARRALEAGMNDPAPLLLAAWSLEAQGRPGRAAPLYQSVVDAQPDNWPALSGLGRVLMDSPKDRDKAASLLARALALDPADNRVRFNLALLRLMQGRPEEAEHLAADFLAKEPGDAAALNLKGLALKAQGKNRQALGAYQRAVEADPGHAQAHYNMGALYAAQLKDPIRASLAFRRFLELEPQGPRADKVREWILRNTQ